MRKKKIITLVVCIIVTSVVINIVHSQSSRPTPVSTSLDPNAKSTGTVDWNKLPQ